MSWADMSEKRSVYAERSRCVIALARLAMAQGHRAGFGVDPAEPDWPVLYIDLPSGQVSWHLTADDRAMAPDIGAYEGTWDGHDTAEKYRRLDALRG
jgi:hypothetical protein